MGGPLDGTLRAIETGFIQGEIQKAAYEFQRAVEKNEQMVVGVNDFKLEEERPIDILARRRADWPRPGGAPARLSPETRFRPQPPPLYKSCRAAPQAQKIFCPPYSQPWKTTPPSAKFQTHCAAYSASTRNPSSSEFDASPDEIDSRFRLSPPRRNSSRCRHNLQRDFLRMRMKPSPRRIRAGTRSTAGRSKGRTGRRSARLGRRL